MEAIRRGFASITGTFRTLHEGVLAKSHADLVLGLTAIFYLFRKFGGAEFFQIIIIVVCLCFLLSSRLLRSSGLWMIMFLCGLCVVFFERSSIDNHKFLMMYWLLACALVAGEKNCGELLRWNARLLIGLAMGFAAIWKIIPGEFLDGSFFHATYLLENRFGGFIIFAGDVKPVEMLLNQRLMFMFGKFPGPDVSVILASSARMPIIALISSYWTILIEGSIGIAFLLCRKSSLDGVRDVLLLIFICTTYFLAPVISFGLILTTLGLAQCPEDRPKTKLAYIYAFLLLQFASFMPELNGFIVDVLT